LFHDNKEKLKIKHRPFGGWQLFLIEKASRSPISGAKRCLSSPFSGRGFWSSAERALLGEHNKPIDFQIL
jgi:hypothetical protein